MYQRTAKFVVNRVVLLTLLIGVPAFYSMAQEGEGEAGYTVQVNVTNEICGYPIAGAMVQLYVDAGVKREGLGVEYTDANGGATFTNLPNAGPFEVGVSVDGYRSQEFNSGLGNEVYAGDVLNVALVPRGVATPGQPNAISSPLSVYIDWPANPEYNIKGYNVYRTLVTEDGTPLDDPVKLNGAAVVTCGDTLVEGLEFIDDTVAKGQYYIYQIQAISGADRPSSLSEPSDPPVKGQWLTIFFPDVNYTNDPDMYLWDCENTGSTDVRIPVASRCAYDIDATSMQIVGEVTSQLLNASPFSVELTGITAGMAYAANIIYGGAVENSGDHQLRIAGASVETRNLYGSGELFNVYLTPTEVLGDVCGPLHLSDDHITGDGVIFYSDPFGPPVEVELEDGAYCAYTGCMHGDVDANMVINNDDAQYILDFIARQSWAVINECYLYSWDINQDMRVTTQDATMIMRWVESMDINPPSVKKSDNLALESFAAAGAVAAKAGTQPTVWADSPVVALNETEDVVVYISGAAPLAGFTLNAAYPAKEVEFVSVTLGSAMPGDSLISASFKITGETDEYGALTVAVTSTSATKATGDAELLKLSFKRISGVTAAVPVVLTSFDMNDAYGHAPRQTDPMAPVISKDAPEGEGEGEPVEGEPPVEGEIEGEPVEGEGEPIEGEIVEGEGETVEGEGEPDIIVWYVTPNGTGSGASWADAGALQATVNAANVNDEVWVAMGTYTSTTVPVLQMKDGVVIYGGFVGSETSRVQRNWNNNSTVIDGETMLTEVYRSCVTGANNAVLDGFTVTCGNAISTEEHIYFGIHNNACSPTVMNCVFTHNYCGMWNESGSSPVVSNCTFTENYYVGMENEDSSPTVTYCIFSNNDDSGMENRSSSPAVNDCVFTSNNYGGMVNFYYSFPTINNCVFKGNKSFNGGGIYNTNNSSPTITNCIFASNEGYQGGGMGNFLNSSPIITNCVFTENYGFYFGGGVASTNGSFPILTNCILWGNVSEDGPEIYNDADSVPVVTYSCVEGGYTGTGNIDADPLFVNSPYSVQLRTGSPCVDTGTTNGAPIADILGRSRPSGSGVDMGPYEGAVSPEDIVTLTLDVTPSDGGVTNPPVGEYEYGRGEIVTIYAQGTGMSFSLWIGGPVLEYTPELSIVMNTNITMSAVFVENIYRVDASSAAVTPDGRSWASAFPTMQAAVDKAAEEGGEIWVASGTYTATTDPVLTMKEGVALYGGFTGTETERGQRDWTVSTTVIDGEDIRRCVIGADYSVLDGFVVTHGSANTDENHSGGGMYNSKSSPTVENCRFEANSSESEGGGMHNRDYSSPKVTNCIFVNNSWEHMHNNNGSSPVITNCTFAGAANGIENSDYTYPIITNCTFWGHSNHAVGSEGISLATITNSILWNNDTEISGGPGSMPLVTYSCIAGGYTGEGNINTNPLFMDAASGDFRLRSDSPCIDTATSNGVPDHDIVGTSRPQGYGYDMGAYEHIPGTPEGELPIEGEGEPVEGEGESEGEGEITPPEMISIAAGTFSMGDPWDEGRSSEIPVHDVTLSAYEIGEYEVTNQEYANILNWGNSQGYLTTASTTTADAYGVQLLEVEASGCQITWSGSAFIVDMRDSQSMADHPVVEVSWYGAAVYCNWLSESQGLTPCYNTSTWECTFSNNGYHLPTEAQWERAAAWNGTQHYRYGNSSDSIICATVNYDYCNPLGLSDYPYTSPVGYYSSVTSPVGCYDMSGNVWEWCNDWWQRVYTTSSVTDPTGPSSGDWRIFRGGGWIDIDSNCRSADRNYLTPVFTLIAHGFRVARTPSEGESEGELIEGEDEGEGEVPAEGEGEILEGEGEVLEGETPDPGSLTVELGPADAVDAGAQWRREGAGGWLDSEAVETDLASGTYRVEFKEVSGWIAPSVQSALVLSGEETHLLAVYEKVGDCVGDPISVWMTGRNANPGEELLVPINVSSADTIDPMGIQIEASYDPTFLDAATVDVRPTAITGKMSFLPNTTEEGRIIITIMGTMGGLGLKGQGHFFDIYGRIRDDVSTGTTSEITLDAVTFYDADINPLCLEVEDTVTLQAGGDALLGDLNGDGKCDIADALWALHVAVGKKPFESENIITGDLNGDNRINCADSVLLQRLAAGFDQVNPEPATDTTSDAMLLANILNTSVPVSVFINDQQGTVGELLEVPVRVNNAQGLSGYDVTLTFDETVFEVEDVLDGTVTSDYPQEWEISEGQLRISMGRRDALYDSEKAVMDATLAIVQFRVLALPADGDTATIRIEDTLALKGQYGDSFEWFTRVNRVNGAVQIKAAGSEGEGVPDLNATAETLLQQFESADTDGDTVLSYEEARVVVPNLTQAQYDMLDANGDGKLTKEELEDYMKEGCGCFGGCNEGKGPIDAVKRMFGDWLLVGLSLLVLVSIANKK